MADVTGAVNNLLHRIDAREFKYHPFTLAAARLPDGGSAPARAAASGEPVLMDAAIGDGRHDATLDTPLPAHVADRTPVRAGVEERASLRPTAPAPSRAFGRAMPGPQRTLAQVFDVLSA